MKKIFLSLLLALTMVSTFLTPVNVNAAPPWWDRFKDIVKADASGAVLGAQVTGTLGGAIGGAVIGSIAEGFNEDENSTGSGWTNDEYDSDESVGIHHNLAMNYIYEKGRLHRATSNSNLLSAKDLVITNEREERRFVTDLILEYLRVKDLYNEDTDRFLKEIDINVRKDYLEDGSSIVKSVDPFWEEIMRLINEGLNKSANNSTISVSDNFYANLEKALSILDKKVDYPHFLIEESAAFFLRASSVESGRELTSKVQDVLNFEKNRLEHNSIDMGNANHDILLAAIYADVLRASYDYRAYDFIENDFSKKSLPGLFEYIDHEDEGDSTEVNYSDDYQSDSKDVHDNQQDKVNEDLVHKQNIKNIVLTLDQPRALVGDISTTMDSPPIVENNRTLVPFSFIGEQIGANVKWHPDERKVSYIFGEKNVELWLGENIAKVDGEEVQLDEDLNVTPVIVNNRTLVPVRFISEALGFEVNWDPDNRQITIVANSNN